LRTVVANGIRLAVAEAGPGDAPPLLFANSLGTDYRVFDALLPHLPPGLRIIRYDKRGHGLSEVAPEAYAMADLVGDVIALLDRLEVPSTIVLGLSIGVVIAQGLAATAPERVRGLILMDTAAKIGSDEMWNARIAAVRKGGVPAIADAIMERWFSPSFLADHPGDVAAFRRMLEQTPAPGYVGACIALRDADYRASAAAIHVPTLVICGSEDRALPPESVRATASAIRGAEFFMVDGSGHFPRVEAPALTGRRIATFLRDKGLVS